MIFQDHSAAVLAPSSPVEAAKDRTWGIETTLSPGFSLLSSAGRERERSLGTRVRTEIVKCEIIERHIICAKTTFRL